MTDHEYAPDWALRHGTGLAPSDHDTLPAPPAECPEQSYALRTALELYARMSDDDVLRFQRAIHQVVR